MNLRAHLTYANVTATLALVVALGAGGAYAAEKVSLPKNSVGAKQIKTNGVKAAEIAKGAVKSSEISDGSVGAADLAPSAIPDAMFAQMKGDGTLLNSSRVVGSSRVSVGRYLVTFDRDVSDCVALATPWEEDQADLITFVGMTPDTVGVDAEVADNANVQDDTQFNLVVVC